MAPLHATIASLLCPHLPAACSELQGLIEMRAFSKALYPTVRDDTFLECCGVGDLVATCYGGRNRLVAEAWTRALLVRVCMCVYRCLYIGVAAEG